MSFKGKVAIVTGGAGGIGRAIAAALAERGAVVCLADLRFEEAERCARTMGEAAFAVPLDVTKQSSIEEMIHSVVARAGGVDILINNAGVFSGEPLFEISEDEFDRVVAVNQRGMLFVLQSVARRMIAQKRGGKIVNTASTAGRRGFANSPVYCMTKAAVISFTQSAAMTLIAHGINVNAIAPGATKTPMWDEVETAFVKAMGQGADMGRELLHATPSGRLGTPADLVGTVLFLASDDCTNLVGQTLNVDGGMVMG